MKAKVLLGSLAFAVAIAAAGLTLFNSEPAEADIDSTMRWAYKGKYHVATVTAIDQDSVTADVSGYVDCDGYDYFVAWAYTDTASGAGTDTIGTTNLDISFRETEVFTAIADSSYGLFYDDYLLATLNTDTGELQPTKITQLATTHEGRMPGLPVLGDRMKVTADIAAPDMTVGIRVRVVVCLYKIH